MLKGTEVPLSKVGYFLKVFLDYHPIMENIFKNELCIPLVHYYKRNNESRVGI